MRSGHYGRVRQISFVQTAAPVAPGQVSGLVAGTPDSSSVPLTWQADAVGTPPISYRIEYKRAADSTWSIDTTHAGTSRTVTGLQAGTAYQFRVRAENAVQAGQYSAVVTAATAAASPTTTLTIGLQGVNRGFQSSSFGSANPTVLAFASGNKTLTAAFLQTDYSNPNGFRLGFTTTTTDGPPAGLFEYVDVEGIGRLMAADAQWFSGQPYYTWGGVPAGTWTASGQARKLTFKLP